MQFASPPRCRVRPPSARPPLPQERRIGFRVGINLADIVVQGDDIPGDGVNIDARLEAVAEPGSICLSEDAFRQVRGKVAAEFTDMGEQSLKNDRKASP